MEGPGSLVDWVGWGLYSFLYHLRDLSRFERYTECQLNLGPFEAAAALVCALCILLELSPTNSETLLCGCLNFCLPLSSRF